MQQPPADIQRFRHRTVFVFSLPDKFFFKSCTKFQILFIGIRKLVLADDTRKISRLADTGLGGKELVCKILMVFPGIFFTDTVLHQTRQ